MSESDSFSQAEINSLLSSLAEGKNHRFDDDSESDVARKSYKLYNFRRPDKFSKEHLKSLQDIHREFSRQLSLVFTAYLRMNINIDVVSVDQLTYDEFIRSVPSPVTIGIVELNPLTGQILLGIGQDILSSIVDRMLGGNSYDEIKARELTDVEEALAKKFIMRIVTTLENAWNHIFPVQGKLVNIDKSYSMIQVATPGEIVALITFEVQIAGRFYGLMSLCFPYPVLENILDQLTSQHIFQTKGLIATAAESKQMVEKLNLSNLKINVELGQAELTVRDLIELKKDDVIRLDNKVTDNLIFKINNKRKFFCTPGVVKNKINVKIQDRYDEVVDTLKNYK